MFVRATLFILEKKTRFSQLIKLPFEAEQLRKNTDEPAAAAAAAEGVMCESAACLGCRVASWCSG